MSFPNLRGFAEVAPLASEIAAVTGAREDISLERAAVEELRRSIRGRVLLPDDDEYDVARRVRNRMIDKRPALITQCVGAGDIREAVDFARHYQLLTAVKCGGHNVAGKGSCEGGIMIDLSPLQGVRVDPIERRARVAGGSLLGSLDQECQSFGLATTAGTVSHTGVGGLTLGGGMGRLARRWGLASDNVSAVDIITADGQFRRASSDENPDLYWAVRGGGGNFGIVSSFEFKLHPLAHKVIGGRIYFPYSEAKNLLNFYAEYCHDMPDEMYADVVIFAPPMGVEKMVYFDVCYSGPHREAECALKPLRQAAKPLRDEIEAIDYVAMQSNHDDNDPRGTGQYLKSGFTREISPELVNALVDFLEPHPLRGGMAFFQQAGGAIGRIAPDETAFPHRYPSHNMMIGAVWRAGGEPDPHIAWARSYWKQVEDFTHGFYTNDEFAVSQSRAQLNFLGNHDRLVAAKNTYDPGNLFRLNSNIIPSV